MRSSLSGPQPVIFGAIAGLALGFLHGFLSTIHEGPTGAPIIEGARGWFLGMAIVIAAIIISGNASTKPKGTPIYGHFFGISKIVQRFIIATAMILGAGVFLWPHLTSQTFEVGLLGTLGLAIALSFPIRDVLEGLYNLSGSILARFQRRPKGQRRAITGSRPPAWERQAPSKRLATTTDDTVSPESTTAAETDPYNDENAHAALEGLLPGYDYPDPDEVKSKQPWWRRKFYDDQGRLITPPEVLRDGNLPPIEEF